ncbi:MAG: sulfite exporter TauE/SafE family protein [Phycisphaerales bacterium]
MLAIVALALGVIALLYASVGHGGASGYLAVLALGGYPPDMVRATALTLNIGVASIAAARFARVSRLRLDLLWPFALTAVPCAFIAGRFWTLDESAYRIAIAGVLLFAAWRLSLRAPRRDDETPRRSPPLVAALLIGATIGSASGLIGVGGGIFLSPVLILCRWANPRDTAGVSAVFIVLSSVAGLLGLGLQLGTLPLRPLETGIFIAAACIGGAIGAGLGARRFNPFLLRRVLAAVLGIAAVKLIIA